jgi:hypothetical protein
MPPRAKRATASKSSRQPVDQKKAKTYRLSEAKIAAARAILGVDTATAAIETALDMVVFRKELIDGIAAMLGVPLTYGDEGDAPAQ